jgi:hypothetical protein
LRATTRGASSSTRRPRASRSSNAAIESTLCGSIGTWQSGQYCTPSLTNSRRRKWCTSVSVPTVLLRPPRLVRCSIATVGGMPKIASTSGREAGCTN